MSDLFDSDRRRRRPATEQGDDDTEPSHSARLRALEDWRLVLTGKDDGNGRFGKLGDRVGWLEKVWKYIAGAVAGSALTAVVAIREDARQGGAKEREAEFLRAEVATLRAEVRELRAIAPAFWMRRNGLPQGDDR